MAEGGLETSDREHAKEIAYYANGAFI